MAKVLIRDDRPFDMPHTDIEFHADVVKNAEGKVVLRFPARHITTGENEVLDTLFPNTRRQIERLLLTETVLACMNSD